MSSLDTVTVTYFSIVPLQKRQKLASPQGPVRASIGRGRCNPSMGVPVTKCRLGPLIARVRKKILRENLTNQCGGRLRRPLALSPRLSQDLMQDTVRSAKSRALASRKIRNRRRYKLHAVELVGHSTSKWLVLQRTRHVCSLQQAFLAYDVTTARSSTRRVEYLCRTGLTYMPTDAAEQGAKKTGRWIPEKFCWLRCCCASGAYHSLGSQRES